MKTLFLGIISLAAAAIAIPAMTTTAQAITKEEARAQCLAQLGGAGSQRSREGGSSAVANCIKQKMQGNKK